MFDHITLGVCDVFGVKGFYDAALGALGYRCVAEEKDDAGRLCAAGYGLKKAFFWICLPLDESRPAAPCNGTHVAFRADTKEQVYAFHDAAMKNGGTDEGPPGPRPSYHDRYYAAFVRDPAGHKIEVVWRNS
jgi:catechol 2,3-dioxygenase-like lactoylglutathione lyase family enzyme